MRIPDHTHTHTHTHIYTPWERSGPRFLPARSTSKAACRMAMGKPPGKWGALPLLLLAVIWHVQPSAGSYGDEYDDTTVGTVAPAVSAYEGYDYEEAGAPNPPPYWIERPPSQPPRPPPGGPPPPSAPPGPPPASPPLRYPPAQCVVDPDDDAKVCRPEDLPPTPPHPCMPRHARMPPSATPR